MRVPQPILRAGHINACLESLNQALVERGGEPVSDPKNSHDAAYRLDMVPMQGAMIGFSKLQMRLLWDAIENGAEAVLQAGSGWSSLQKAAFREAANRLREAGQIDRPKF